MIDSHLWSISRSSCCVYVYIMCAYVLIRHIQTQGAEEER